MKKLSLIVMVFLLFTADIFANNNVDRKTILASINYYFQVYGHVNQTAPRVITEDDLNDSTIAPILKEYSQFVFEQIENDSQVVFGFLIAFPLLTLKGDEFIGKGVDSKGNTFLHVATYFVRQEIVDMIQTKYPYLIAIKNKDNYTPHELAYFFSMKRYEEQMRASLNPIISVVEQEIANDGDN